MIQLVGDPGEILNDISYSHIARGVALETISYLATHYPNDPLVVAVTDEEESDSENVYVGRPTAYTEGKDAGFINGILGDDGTPDTLELEQPARATVGDEGVELTPLQSLTITLENPLAAYHPAFNGRSYTALVIHDQRTGEQHEYEIEDVPPSLRRNSIAEREGSVTKYHVSYQEEIREVLGSDFDSMKDTFIDGDITFPIILQRGGLVDTMNSWSDADISLLDDNINPFVFLINQDEFTQDDFDEEESDAYIECTVEQWTEVQESHDVELTPAQLTAFFDKGIELAKQLFGENGVLVLNKINSLDEQMDTDTVPVTALIGESTSDGEYKGLQNPHILVTNGDSITAYHVFEVLPSRAEIEQLKDNPGQSETEMMHNLATVDTYQRYQRGFFLSSPFIVARPSETTDTSDIGGFITVTAQKNCEKQLSYASSLQPPFSDIRELAPATTSLLDVESYDQYSHYYCSLTEGESVLVPAAFIDSEDDDRDAVNVFEGEVYTYMIDGGHRYIPATITTITSQYIQLETQIGDSLTFDTTDESMLTLAFGGIVRPTSDDYRE